jgi:hypothetical protein
MPRYLVATLTALALAAPLAGASAADVGVSISISQPGVYGRIDIGRFPQPVVVAPQPVVIVPPPRQVVVAPQPVYMWVPPGHQKNWRKHCARYGACGVPVYFVQDGWYQQHVHKGPGREHPGKGHGHGKGKGRDD